MVGARQNEHSGGVPRLMGERREFLSGGVVLELRLRAAVNPMKGERGGL